MTIDKSDIKRPASRRAVLLSMLGILLIQAAWILVVPPFRGIDEIDHAYRAAAVARGDWQPTHVASPQGWGAFVEVPSDIVVVARPICEWMPYTHSDNCVGTGTDSSGTTRVASSATRYNPLFYFAIGTAALPFSGADALYSMRIAASILCTFLLALAVVATSRWARSPWPWAAMLLAATPTFMYSSVVVAPNGLELCAGLAVWSATLGLARTRESPHSQRSLILIATVAAVPLVLVRGLGPLWLLLIVMTVAPLFTWADLVRLLRRRDTKIGIGIILVATLAAASWTLSAGVRDIVEEEALFTGSPWPGIPGQWILWFFQSFAAFPGRRELAALPLYMIGLAAWWVFTAAAWRVAHWRVRKALVVVLVLATLVPIAATVATYSTFEYGWQGRYTYPYAIGFILLCGFALDRAASADFARRTRWPIWAAAAVVLVTEVIGQLRVLSTQASESPLRDSEAWIQPDAWLIIALNVGGALLWAGGFALSRCPGADSAGRSPALLGRGR